MHGRTISNRLGRVADCWLGSKGGWGAGQAGRWLTCVRAEGRRAKVLGRRTHPAYRMRYSYFRSLDLVSDRI